MRPGRNDPCPCGSGLKYKKCCLARDEAAAGDRPQRDGSEPSWRDRVFGRLTRFVERPDLRQAAQAALRRFVAPGRFDHDKDSERLAGAVATSQAAFFFWFCLDYVLPDGGTPAEAFLASEGQRLNERERAHVERLRDSRLGLYEVLQVRLDQGLRLVDIGTGDEADVRERAATRQLARFDLLAARLVPFEDGVPEIEGPVMLFPPRSKPTLRDLVKKSKRRRRSKRPSGEGPGAFAKDPGFAVAVHEAWLEWTVFPPLPTLLTSEREPVMFAKTLFDIRGRAEAVRATLDRHAALRRDDDEYTWGEPTEDGRRELGHIRIEDERLALETMSQGRAERGRALLEAALGDLIRHRATRLEDPHQAVAAVRGKRTRDEDADRLPPEVEAQVVAEYQDRHYRDWLDQPVPALGGRTPRQAARSKAGRARLTDLLKDFENSEARAAHDGHLPYDFSWLWTELGLTRP